jgi:alkanesulfonate monooxygenase SsuD/methylene tetrahydromethanopterin reductase-like flavin-dependent oxidoreductase (luciferase family)
MGSRYLFIALYCWLEKYFTHGDYRKVAETAEKARVQSAWTSDKGNAPNDLEEQPPQSEEQL